jgi:hypothetical protein
VGTTGVQFSKNGFSTNATIEVVEEGDTTHDAVVNTNAAT